MKCIYYYMTKNLTILFILLTSSLLTEAQINIEMDTTILNDSIPQADTVEVNVWDHYDWQPFVAFALEVGPDPDGYFESYSWQAGVIYKQHFYLAAFATEYQGDIQSTVVFPNEFNLLFKHGGASIGYKTSRERRVEILVGSQIGWGSMLWKLSESGRNFIKDDLMVIHPFVSADISIVKYASANIAIGYRKLVGLDLASVNPKDFEGITATLTLRLGRFDGTHKEWRVIK